MKYQKHKTFDNFKTLMKNDNYCCGKLCTTGQDNKMNVKLARRVNNVNVTFQQLVRCCN